MCRWGCGTHDTTYMCKWCGTRYCTECGRGDFPGTMKLTDNPKCRVCFQPRLQGKRVEYVPSKNPTSDDATSKRGRSASSKRGKSASSKKSKSAKSKKNKKRKK